VDAAEKGKSFGKGGGKGRRGAAVGEPVKPLRHDVAERYKEALDCAVRLSVAARLPKLSGRTLVLCDVSGSMRYNDFAISAKGVGGVTSAADLAILMGILLFSMSEGPGHCCVALFSDGPSSPRELTLYCGESVFRQFVTAKEQLGDMGVTTELPLQWLEAKLSETQAERVVILSDMLIGQSRNHPGGGGKLQELLTRHRQHSKKQCRLVCVDLFGSGATAGVDHTGDCGPGDVLVSGFSDHVFKFIASPDVTAQVKDVEGILELVRAQEAERAPREQEKEAVEDAEVEEEPDENEEAGEEKPEGE